jgi:hypothetical protein
MYASQTTPVPAEFPYAAIRNAKSGIAVCVCAVYAIACTDKPSQIPDGRRGDEGVREAAAALAGCIGVVVGSGLRGVREAAVQRQP